YEVYIPKKAESYNPETLIKSGSVSVSKTDGFTWIELPLDVVLEESRHIFIVLKENENIVCATSSQYLAGVVCSYRQPCNSVTIIDIDTLNQKEEIWHRLHNTLCFEAGTDENIFSGENLTNGYARPHGVTNIWHSKQVEGEYFTLTFPEKKTLNEMVLIFDSYLDICYHTTSPSPDRSGDGLVSDYNVYGKNDNGEFVQIMEVRDNHQRVNTLDLEGVETSELKVEFLKTRGQKFVGVYSVRVYE
ncbi:MAG: hypothetical protein IJN39_02890, partial [Clostridia bacterium]|nr:hypothetical protein [Clostridia bacterium]